MCLIVLAYRHHPDFPLVFAANRDEFYDRPAAPAAFWDDAPDLLAGRDLRAGGTWCGLTRAGRFGAVTNYRDLRRRVEGGPSRGRLVPAFLQGTQAPPEFLEELAGENASYDGFNLLVGDRASVGYYSNREEKVRRLGPGVYGLSNHLLDTPWPKVERAREAMTALLAEGPPELDPLFALLADDQRAPDEALPDTGVGHAMERMLSSVFITSPGYGTRASTVFWVDRDGHATFAERTFSGAAGAPVTRRFDFAVEPAAV